jgi:hypothetical protein
MIRNFLEETGSFEASAHEFYDCLGKLVRRGIFETKSGSARRDRPRTKLPFIKDLTFFESSRNISEL